MRTTQLYAPTLRETPADAEVVSHQLMLRAGLIRKAAGGQELSMPIIQPAELWYETGRWDFYGDEMFCLKDRHDRSF